MGQSDYYADGQYNVICDLCSKKIKSNDARKTWDNFYVCAHHKEVRNPQDFIRGVMDNQSVPFSRPGAPNTNPPTGSSLLMEDGSYLLLENGSYILLE